MKLYATTTSERASKGQGGNEFLNITIASGSAKDSYIFADIIVDKSGFIYFRNGDKKEIACYTTQDGKLVDITNMTKGEKQKGDEKHCNECMSTPCGQL